MADDYQLEARMRVLNFFNDFKLDTIPPMTLDMVYVVWFCKTLKNWKALVSTVIPDGHYYEVTFNGENGSTYIDVYEKSYNFEITPNIDKPDDDQLALTLDDFSEEAVDAFEALAAQEAAPNN